MPGRHPIQCILPPHILDAIEQRGSEPQRNMARAVRSASDRIRVERQVIARGARAAVTPSAGKDRIVYTANTGTSLPGTAVRSEGAPASGDVAVDEAYDGSGDTYDLYEQVYNRSSLDGQGMRLASTVHYRQGYDNAFWNGQQMVYGDGDEDLPPAQRLFTRFTKSLDVIGHELTHGVTQFSANLVYNAQPGALNESFSDVFGSLVKQRRLDQAATEADWLIGAELLTANVHGDGLRSMKAPGTAYDDPVLGKDPQPAHMSNYVNTTQDNGGVHINSGIPNHAFYVTAVQLGGRAWEKAGAIWYQTLTDGRLGSQADFQHAADLTFLVAGERFGVGGSEQAAVKAGWAAVGITVGDVPNTPPSSPPKKGCLPAIVLGLLG